MRVAVTGAAGFVGRALLQAAATAGHETVALTRRAGPVAGAAHTVTITGLDDADALRRALDGCDAVVHLAARVHVMRREGAEGAARFAAVNVEGTRAVRDAALAAGVRRLVHLSTAKVHGEGGGAPYRDADPLRPQGAYAGTKADAERLLGATDPARLGWTILRPPLVYGPGVGGNFRRLLQLAALGARLPLPLGGLDNRRSLVAVDNLADAILVALTHPAAVGRAFVVGDAESPSTSELLGRLGAALGRPVRLWPLPRGLLRAAFTAVGRGGEAARLLESFEVDASGIRAALEWRAPLTLDEGLARVAAWWRTARDAPGGADG